LFNEYSVARGNLAYRSDQLLPTDSNSLYFNPNLGALRDLYNDGNLAVVRNLGNLIENVTPADFANESSLSRPVGLVGSGWGGRMADLLMEANQNTLLPPSISLNNANFFQPGNRSSSISVDPLGGPKLLTYLDKNSNARNSARDATLDSLLSLPSNNSLEEFAASSYTKARDSSRVLSSVISSTPEFGPLPTGSSVEAQLQMVARLIAGRNESGMRRQIFFVGFGGWDTHNDQASRLNGLTTQLNASLAYFQQTLTTMGVENDVTTFTASDFGRTLTPNNTGSDHGWGGHYLVMGGAVNGGQLYGSWPDYALNGEVDIGGGRLIPGMSINQYGAALGSWMGLSNSDLLEIFPDLNRFDTGWQNQYGLFT